jgi:predicted  nucleic acid-binding Zn-ribbon protein
MFGPLAEEATMRFHKKVSLFSLLLFTMLCTVSTGSAQNELKTSEPDPTIKSLLNEVRLLRQTLQNTGLNAYRSQILLERIKISNEQVVRLTQALSETRDQMEKTALTIPRMGEQQKVLETMVEAEVDLAKRARMEFEVKDIKHSIERYRTELDRMKEREQQQTTQLREEQSKLSDLETRLQRLEDQIENEIQRLKEEPVKQP